MGPRHFLTLNDLSPEELEQVIHRAIELKKDHKNGVIYEPMKGKVMGMIFENPPPVPEFLSSQVWPNLEAMPFSFPLGTLN